jgi:hypothetical protein
MIELTKKTQAQQDIDTVNATLRPVIANIVSGIEHLNNSRSVFWSFSDDRLNAMFAKIGTEKLNDIFENHKASAELINELARRCGVDVVAEIGAMRKLKIVDGLVQVEPEPEPQIKAELEPEPEPQPEP